MSAATILPIFPREPFSEKATWNHEARPAGPLTVNAAVQIPVRRRLPVGDRADPGHRR